MKKKSLAIFCSFLATVLISTSALAGGAVKLDSVDFSLGSLIASGTVSGLGHSEVAMVLDASGPSDVTCSNPNSHDLPGHTASEFTFTGSQTLTGTDVRRHGTSSFRVETADTEISWEEGGCPDPSWSAHIDFTYYNRAIIRIYDTHGGELLLEQDYTCTTTRFPATVSCRLDH